MTDRLFRDDAVRFRYGPQAAGGSNVPPIAHWLVAAGAALLVAILVTILWLGAYTASDSVRGYIAPSAGSVRIVAPRSGIVVERLVADGDTVIAGMPLLRVSAERLANGASVDAALITDLEAEQAGTVGQIKRARRLHASKLHALANRLQALREQLGLLQTQLDYADEALELSAAALRRAKTLARRGHVAAHDVQQRRAAQLVRQQERAALAAEAALLQRRIEAQRRDLADEPLRQQNELATLQARRLQLQRDLSQARALAAFTLTAPVAGVISGLTTVQGNTVHDRELLMTLLPLREQLCAVLLVPSRTSGFIRPGDQVRLRIDAYPHQKYGAIRGRVRSRSRAVMMPGDFDAPLAFNEPAYRVEVELEAQTLPGAGGTLYLQPGMTVVADVLRDRRRLIEWLLEPLIGAMRRT